MKQLLLVLTVTVGLCGQTKINLQTQVSGTLPKANGGTGRTSWTAEKCVRSNASGELESAAADCGTGGGDSHPSRTGKANYVLGVNAGETADEWKNVAAGATGGISVTHSVGGITIDIVTAVLPQKSAANTFTGQNTFDQGIIQSPRTAPGSPTNGQSWYDSSANKFRCRENGATVDCIGSGGGGSHTMLSSTHTDSTTGTVVRGDLITGQGASPTWTRLAKGAAGQGLRMDGSGVDVGWADMVPDPGGNGVVVRTAANTSVNRTITGTANEVTVTNGDGVSANPTISRPDIGGGTYSWWTNLKNPVSGANAAQTVGTSVKVFLVELTGKQTFVKGSVNIETVYSGGNLRVGVYSMSGGVCADLLFQTGNISTTSSGVQSGTFTSNQLSPGFYYMAIAADNGTVQVRGYPSGTAFNDLMNAGSLKYIGTATNAASFPDTGLPSTCGGMTAGNQTMPGMVFSQ